LLAHGVGDLAEVPDAVYLTPEERSIFVQDDARNPLATEKPSQEPPVTHRHRGRAHQDGYAVFPDLGSHPFGHHRDRLKGVAGGLPLDRLRGRI
jgi:hypothetical protein